MYLGEDEQREFEAMMNPLSGDMGEPDWDTIDTVQAAMKLVSSDARDILEMVFYDRLSFSQLAERLGTTAKSYAWRRCQKAINELREVLMKNESIRRKYDY